MTGRYHCFSNHWRDPSTGSDCYKRFPYVLELGVDLDGAPLLPFHGDDTTGNRILVTKAYEEMFYRILRLRKMDKGTRRGVVITGQPGIGASSIRSSPVRPLTGTSIFRENNLPEAHARIPD